MKLSAEQQKLYAAIWPFVNGGAPSMGFILMQLIDRYWQPKPVDVEWVDLSTDLYGERLVLKDEYHRRTRGILPDGAKL